MAKSKAVLILLYILLLPVIYPHKAVLAQQMSSPNFKIEGGNLNSSASSQNSSGYRLIDLVGQTSAQTFTAKGYILNSGFFNRSSGSSIGLTLDKSSINFEAINPDKVYSDTIKITVNNSEFPGYSLYLSEITPLITENGAEIADTLCDAASDRLCSGTKANRWTNPKAFGFGYNLSGKYASSDFNGNSMFRPFARFDTKQQPALVANSSEKKSQDIYNLNLKLLVSRSQPVGIYRNILNLQLVPGY